MQKKELLFNGNEKQVFATDDPELVIFRFKDVLTAYNGVKRAVLKRKGIVNTSISSLVFEYLKKNGIKTHYIEKISDREQLCYKIEIIPIQVIIRNIVAGTLSERMGIDEGFRPSEVIYEIRYNNDQLGDPYITDTEATGLGIVKPEDLRAMYEGAARINDLLVEMFGKAGLELVDLKLEFGRASDGSIILSDEISPDTCRIWEVGTQERLDKDRFRHDLGDVVAAYEKVLAKLQSTNDSEK